MSIRVEHGDMRVVLGKMVAEGRTVQSVVTDPPYHLQSIVKRFANSPRTEASMPSAGPYERQSRGFMGKMWDGGDIAFQPGTWRLCFDLLPPGGHLLAFAGTRTYHRMAVAIEEAGFEIRDTISWLYGSGFPKSHNVSKGIDRAAGAEREVIAEGEPVKRMIPGADQAKQGWEKNNGRVYVPTKSAAGTPEAAAWDGWGTALKPAMELICVARKPLDGTVAGNVLKHGTGALNIDACRVTMTDDDRAKIDAATYYNSPASVALGTFASIGSDKPMAAHSAGRWPANVCHDGSDEVVSAFPNSDPSNLSDRGTMGRSPFSLIDGSGRNPDSNGLRGHADSGGSVARFFYSSKADADDRLGSKHPTVKPVDLMRWLVRLVTPPGGTVLDPFAGSGTTGMACMAEGIDCILVEREAEYVADIKARIAHVRGDDTPLFATAAE